MTRWSYLIPRLVILGLILLAAWIGIDPLVKYAIVQNGQQLTGAKVEIGKVRTSLANGKVYIKDLRIADPRNPMLNMVQADTAYMVFNPRRLLHREIVIEHGTTHQILFGAPRTESGSLNPATTELPGTLSPETGVVETAANNSQRDLQGQAWLDSLKPGGALSNDEAFEIVRIAEQLNERWPAEFDARKGEIIAVRQAITSVREILAAVEDNPLRDEIRYQRAQSELVRLQSRISALQSELLNLEREALAGRDQLMLAAKRDQAGLSAEFDPEMFEGESLSRVLLTVQQEKQVNDIVGWFRWFRMTMPDPQRDFSPATGRGTDFVFKGAQPGPDFLIKTLELDGEGQFAGQHFSFSGTAKDVTPQPWCHDQPVTIELRAQGRQHLIVQCTLDRRGEVADDSLYISSPDIETPSSQLGEQQALVISMGPARVQVEVALQMNGDELSGDVVFRYSNVSLFAERIHDLAGGEDAARYLNQEIAAIDSYQSNVRLQGSLDNPHFTFESDLGGRFAGIMNRAAANKIQAQLNARNERLQQILHSEIESLDRTIEANLEQIATILESERSVIAELQESARKAEEQKRFR